MLLAAAYRCLALLISDYLRLPDESEHGLRAMRVVRGRQDVSELRRHDVHEVSCGQSDGCCGAARLRGMLGGADNEDIGRPGRGL